MRILIIAATEPEIGLLKQKFDHSPTIDFLITGVGMVATAFALGQHLARDSNYHLAINLGIAGSFDRVIALGEIVEVVDDTLAELGAEDGDLFIPIEEMGFGKSRFYATSKLEKYIDEPQLKIVTAVTVNTVHGNTASIQNLMQRLPVTLESMEGAAFFYACEKVGLPCIQIRAVSNYVERRDRSNWQIGLAIQNLNNFAVGLLAQLVVCNP